MSELSSAGSISDVPGVRVGHAQNVDARTGCTAVLFDDGAVGGVDVRGSAPGTHEIETLKPVRLVERVHGVFLTGGSAFGLGAVAGVQRYLEEQGIGFDTSACKVPIVPAAVIYDLAVGDASVRPGPDMGYAAAIAASREESGEGLVGAGTGATVGKMMGYENAMPGGVGTCSMKLGEDVVVGALAVVNPLGDVRDPETGEIVAGARGQDGGYLDSARCILHGPEPTLAPSSNTTLVVVATNAGLTKEQAIKVAQMSQDGLSRAISPAHTMFDGDVSFAFSTGALDTDVNRIGVAAACLTSRAIVRAVKAAAGGSA